MLILVLQAPPGPVSHADLKSLAFMSFFVSSLCPVPRMSADKCKRKHWKKFDHGCTQIVSPSGISIRLGGKMMHPSDLRLSASSIPAEGPTRLVTG
jgi:hypothetical protein